MVFHSDVVINTCIRNSKISARSLTNKQMPKSGQNHMILKIHDGCYIIPTLSFQFKVRISFISGLWSWCLSWGQFERCISFISGILSWCLSWAQFERRITFIGGILSWFLSRAQFKRGISFISWILSWCLPWVQFERGISFISFISWILSWCLPRVWKSETYFYSQKETRKA